VPKTEPVPATAPGVHGKVARAKGSASVPQARYKHVAIAAPRTEAAIVLVNGILGAHVPVKDSVQPRLQKLRSVATVALRTVLVRIVATGANGESVPAKACAPRVMLRPAARIAETAAPRLDLAPVLTPAHGPPGLPGKPALGRGSVLRVDLKPRIVATVAHGFGPVRIPAHGSIGGPVAMRVHARLKL